MEAHDAGLFFAPDQERIAFLHPGVRFLHLESVAENLLEQAVAIEDAVALDRQVQAGAGVEKTGSQPAQAAVTKVGVRSRFQDIGQVAAVRPNLLLNRFVQAEVDQVVFQGAPHQELG